METIDHHDDEGAECPLARLWAKEIFADNAAHLLNLAAQEARAAFTQALAPLGVSPRQLGVLQILAHREPLRQNEIGQLLGIDRTSMVAVIDGLEGLSLVVRTCDPNDRRAHALRLTPKGKETEALAQDVIREAQARFLKPLSDEDWQSLRSSLRKLTE